MACNCATQEQLKMLYKTYGEKVDERLSKSSKLRFKNFLYKVGVGICIMMVTPFLVVYALYKAFGDKDKRISIKKFFNIKTVKDNVR